MYYLHSENKVAHKPCGYSTADLLPRCRRNKTKVSHDAVRSSAVVYREDLAL